MANKFKLDETIKRFDSLKRSVPILLANQAQTFFVQRFKEQSWPDTGNWKQVQRRIQGTNEYKYPKSKGLSRRVTPILVRTGALRRAVSTSIRQATFEKIRLDVPTSLVYAGVHNFGTNRIPMRKFMGDTPILRKKQLDLIQREFNKAFK